MELLLYIIIIMLYADHEAHRDTLSIQLGKTINHSKSWIKRAVFALLIALMPNELRHVVLIVPGGGIFGAYFMVRLNVLRRLEAFYISDDPKGSKIDYAFSKLSKRFGGLILFACFLVVAAVGVWIWFAWR